MLDVSLILPCSPFIINFPDSVQFSSVRGGIYIYALGKAHMSSATSLGSFLSVAFETVPMLVGWLNQFNVLCHFRDKDGGPKPQEVEGTYI